MSVLRGDALTLPLDAASVDLIVTSPPYFAQRSYRDGDEHYEGQVGDEATPFDYVDAMFEAMTEMRRVLKPTGSIFVNLDDKYAVPPLSRAMDWAILPKSLMGTPWRLALRCIDELGMLLRAEIIWEKPNGLPESVRDRVRRSHERWFHFTLQQDYWSDLDALRTPHASEDGRTRIRSSRYAEGSAGSVSSAGHPAGRLPGSVWHVPSEPLRPPPELGVQHDAPFPSEWPRRLIRGWCPVGGVVLDPFGGSGTTALVAESMNRHGISLDMSADYTRLAQWRTTDIQQRVAAARKNRRRVEVEPDGTVVRSSHLCCKDLNVRPGRVEDCCSEEWEADGVRLS